MTRRQTQAAVNRYRLEEEAELAAWLVRQLKPGESTVYWRGFLAVDRSKTAVRELANEITWRAAAGQILLTQRRLKPVKKTPHRGKTVALANYAYIATRRRHA